MDGNSEIAPQSVPIEVNEHSTGRWIDRALGGIMSFFLPTTLRYRTLARELGKEPSLKGTISAAAYDLGGLALSLPGVAPGTASSEYRNFADPHVAHKLAAETTS